MRGRHLCSPILALLLGFLTSLHAVAASVGVDATAEQINLNQSFEYWVDDSAHLSLQQVLAQPRTWQRQTDSKPNFGYSAKAYWLHFSLRQQQHTTLERWLELSYPLLDEVQVWLLDDKQQIQRYYHTGDNLTFEQRPIQHRLFIFPLSLPPQQTYHVYLRIQSTSGLQTPMTLWSVDKFQQHDQLRQWLLGLFYGALLVMAGYNLFIWLSVREKSYLFYVVFVFCFGTLFASLDGFLYQYIWPNAVEWNNKSVAIELAITLALSMVFSKFFLHTEIYNPRLNKALIVMIVIMATFAVLSFFLPYRPMILSILSGSIIVALLVITTGICNWRAGNRAARFFVMAWAFLATMVILYDLSQLTIIPKTVFGSIAVQLGELCEVLLLSFALADRININRLERIAAQQLALEEERRANAEREEHLHTKLHAREEELRARHAIYQAQSESRAKSLFLATMSHEIRTPMNGVLGMTELLQNTPLSPQQQQYLQVINNSGQALLNIINDILDYSKIEAGRMEIEHIDMDLDKLILECASVFALTAEQKQLEFLAFVEPSTPLFIRSDPTRLRQILLNLLGNAFKFTPHGQVSLRIHCRQVEGQRPLLHFEVSDTGIGISEEKLAKLFHAFEQADGSTTRRFGGTGLGLSITRQLVVLLGGDIGVSSQEGQGSHFWFELPLIEANSTYVAEHFVPLTALQGLRILFVDDSIDFVHMMVEQANAWGMVAEYALNGEQCLSKLRAAIQQGKPFDMVTLDMRMPDLNGLEVAQHMHADPQLANTRRILLTAMRMPPTNEQLRHVGLSLVIQKPTSASALRDALLRLLGCDQEYRSVIDRRSDPQQLQELIKGRHVLVVEDNAVNQMVIVGMLKRLGLSSELANNGLEALECYRQNPLEYDLVLMDCEMPEMDGYQATEAMRKFEQERQLRPVVIVALTAHALREQQEQCLLLGMNDYLTKPLELERLKQLLLAVFLPQGT